MISDEDPCELLASMLDHMRFHTLKMAPRVCELLGKITNNEREW
jgi:hypothetical protein